jgi:GNAT superfamily N-acetyltransferase
MRDKDIKNLLAHVEKSLVNIKNTYDQSLHDQTILPFLSIDIKNTMENLRSALDYMAKDIATIVCKKDTLKKTYFPYGENKQNFDSSIKKNLPNLRMADPDIHSLIESMQSHTCEDPWLYNFCQILNNNKHDSLSPLKDLSKNSDALPGRKLHVRMMTLPKEREIAKHFRQKHFFDRVPIQDPYLWTFDHKDHLHFILYEGSGVVGYAHIQLWPDHRAAIRIIVIDEKVRGQGMGKYLMDFCERVDVGSPEKADPVIREGLRNRMIANFVKDTCELSG